MGMCANTKVMLGYDISDLAGYIEKLEHDNKEFENGIPGYSLNCYDTEIGYCGYSKKSFGIEIADIEELNREAKEDGEVRAFGIEELKAKHKDAIWERYKSFLSKHIKITDTTEPELKLMFVSYVN